MSGYRDETRDGLSIVPHMVWSVLFAVGLGASVILGLLLSDRALTKLGFIFGCIGLLVSVAGFGFTIWQLLRTQRAADAATEALQTARKEFATLDVLGELHIMRITSESVREHVVGLRWPSANFGYDRLREKLMRVISVPEQLTHEESEIAKDFVAHILGVSSETEALAIGDPFDVVRLTARLKELENFALQVEYRIRDQFRGS